MTSKTLYLTLAICATAGCLLTWSWWGILPALGALLVVKLTRAFRTWRGPVVIYVLLFVLAMIVQVIGGSE